MVSIDPRISKPILVGLAALSLGGLHFAARKLEDDISPRAETPSSFTLQERYMTIGTDFMLKDDQGAFGTIDEEVLNFFSCFCI